MGMYTAIHFNSELRKETPKEVIEVLRFMVESQLNDDPPSLPDHPFFRCERWRFLFKMDSYYFDEDTHSTLRFDNISDTYYLCVRANLKNYDGEIEKFVDWIQPYLEKQEGDFLGFSRYEETEDPEIIRKDGRHYTSVKKIVEEQK